MVTVFNSALHRDQLTLPLALSGRNRRCRKRFTEAEEYGQEGIIVRLPKSTAGGDLVAETTLYSIPDKKQ